MRLDPFYYAIYAPLVTLSTSIAFAAFIPQPSPSPCFTIAPFTASNSVRTSQYITPTAQPELRPRFLRRQLSNSLDLGINDPSTCNVGVCDEGTYCTVFRGFSIDAALVTGLCLANGARLTSFTECQDYTSTSGSDKISISTGQIISGTSFCGASYPYCSSRYVQTGYGVGTFLWRDCWNNTDASSSTILNPSWRLYADTSSTESITSGTSATSSITAGPTATTPAAESTSSGEKITPLSPGAIAGISIGCIIVATLGVAAVMVVWSKTHNQAEVGNEGFLGKEPTPAYYSGIPQGAAGFYPYTRQPVEVPGDGDLRIQPVELGVGKER
ncbi:hypothetical protein K440DRAFT_609698 [Wilcoxina mikolae CBS 423.85]|nr:hypothetical protein K440DRAFT_609698 [Wilcoxina mikolae CBS 423.85]